MKRVLVGILAVISLCVVTASDEVYAKQNKQEQEAQMRMEYLNLDWWNNFNDSNLTSYMQELYEKNNDLKIAALRVKEGEKMARISLAREIPQVSFNGDIGRIMPSSEQRFGHLMRPSYSQYTIFLPLNASYELDIWGENRFRTKSVEKQVEMVKQDERATYILLTSAFASEYYNLVKVNKFIDLQKEIVSIQEDITSKTEMKYKSGLANKTDFLDAKKVLTQDKATLNNLEKSKVILENQLKAFLTDSKKELKTISYEDITIPEGIPETYESTSIEKRPDYLRAETYIKKIGCDVSIAKRELLPKFTIYGQIGFNAYEWGDLFKDFTQLANAGILPSWNLFAGGRKMAFLKLKKYQYEEAVQKYQKTILSSIQELNDNTVIYQTAQKNYEQSKERVQFEADKFALIENKKEIGAVSDYENLFYKKKYLNAQKDEISDKINCLISMIGIYKAVGGQDLAKISSDI